MFKVNEIVQHAVSGKFYIVTGIVGTGGTIGVYGWRNDKEFGPVRFIAPERLRSLPEEANAAS